MSTNNPIKATVNLKSIVRLPELRGRADVANEHEVAVEYAALIKRADERNLPNPFADSPVTLVELPDGRVVLADGWKRTEAFEICTLPAINAEVWKGDWNFAVEMASKSNQGHGVRRTNKDKRHVAENMIDQWFERADSWIGDELGISAALVASVRAAEIERRQKAGEEVPTTRVGKNNKVMNVTAIGKSDTDKTKAVKRERRAKAALNKTPDVLKDATKALAEKRAETTGVETPDASMVESARAVTEEIARTGGYVTVPTVDGDKQVPADALMTYDDGKTVVQMLASEVAAIHTESIKADAAAQHRNGFQPDLKIRVRGQEVTQGKKQLGTTIGNGAALVVAQNEADSKLFDELAMLIKQYPQGALELSFWREGKNGVKPIVRPSKNAVSKLVDASQTVAEPESIDNSVTDAAPAVDASTPVENEAVDAVQAAEQSAASETQQTSETPVADTSTTAKASKKRNRSKKAASAEQQEQQPEPEALLESGSDLPIS